LVANELIDHTVSKPDQGVLKELISRNLVCADKAKMSNQFFDFLEDEILLRSIKIRL